MKRFDLKVSIEDLQLLKSYPWYLDKQSGYVVAVLGSKKHREEALGSKVYLHRMVLKAQPGHIVDHINRDRLDNRRENLRFVTARENCENRGIQKNNKVGEKNITARRGKFRVTKNGKYLGDFKTLAEAVSIRDRYLKLKTKKVV
jgi:hypothetical protein